MMVKASKTTRISKLLRPGSLGQAILRGTRNTAGLKFASIGLRFLATICLARVLGVSDYGAYAFALTVTTLTCEPVFNGLGRVTLRHTAQLQAAEKWSLLRGLHRRFQQIFLGTAALSTLLLLSIGVVGDRFWPAASLGTFAAAALLPATLALLRYHQALLNGLGRFAASQAPKLVLRPALYLALLGIILWREMSITPAAAMVLFALAGAAAAGVSWAMHRRHFPAEAFAAPPEYDTRQWMHGAPPLVLTAVLLILWTQGGVLVVGALASARDTGLFHASLRLAEFIGLFHLAAAIPMQPIIARLHGEGDMARLQRVISKSTWAILAVTALPSLVLLIWAKPILGLFGSNFSDAATALQLLALSKLLSVALGHITVILAMMNRGGESARGIMLGAIVNIGLCVLLVPTWGLNGAAMASLISVVVSKGYLAWRMRRLMGIDPSVLGLILPPRARPTTVPSPSAVP